MATSLRASHVFNRSVSLSLIVVLLVTACKMNTQRDTTMSVSTYDEEADDMINGGLFMRDWKLVGTSPPYHSSSPDSSVNDMLDHLVMFYKETLEGMQLNEDSSDDRSALSPIVLSSRPIEAVELMPIAATSLGPYYDYFSQCVATNRSDQLLNICKRDKKSPCFDIKNCYLVQPSSTHDLPNFAITEVSGKRCAPLVPTSIIYNIMDSLTEIGISIVPTIHDALAFNGCRVRMSELYTSCEIPDSEWKGNTFTRDFSRLLRCSAVTTATLTVSVVLSVAYGPKSRYHHRKTLTIVVHSIK